MYALNKQYALNNHMRLTTSIYGIMKLTRDNLKLNSIIEQFSFSIGSRNIRHVTMQTRQDLKSVLKLYNVSSFFSLISDLFIDISCSTLALFIVLYYLGGHGCI